MTCANTRSISKISRESYGTEHYEGPYLLNHTEKDLSEGGSTIILVSSIADSGDQNETSSDTGSGALSSKILISDDRQGNIEIKSTYTRESTQTALFMASLHERDKQRKARLGRCHDAMSRPEREEYARRFSLQRLVYRYYVVLLQKDGSNDSVKYKQNGSGIDQASSGLWQDLLVKAVLKAEQELPQAGKVDDKMKESVVKQLQEERDQRDRKESAQARKA